MLGIQVLLGRIVLLDNHEEIGSCLILYYCRAYQGCTRQKLVEWKGPHVLCSLCTCWSLHLLLLSPFFLYCLHWALSTSSCHLCHSSAPEKKRCCKALASTWFSVERKPSASPWGGGGETDSRRRELSHPRDSLLRLCHRAHEVAPSEVCAELVRSRCQSSASGEAAASRKAVSEERERRRSNDGWVELARFRVIRVIGW
jgi:hypothetical protein